MPPAPTLNGDAWTPSNVLAIIGYLVIIGMTVYNTIGHRDNKAGLQAVSDKADIAVNLSGKALAATPSPVVAPAPTVAPGAPQSASDAVSASSAAVMDPNATRVLSTGDLPTPAVNTFEGTEGD